METKQYTRKPFPVSAVQVTLQNIEEVAQWCNGTIEYRPTKMMGTITDLPVIRLKGLGDKDFEAALGFWVVELKGSFRSYKPAAFEGTFDELPQVVTGEEGTPERLQEAEEFAYATHPDGMNDVPTGDLGIYDAGNELRLVEGG